MWIRRILINFVIVTNIRQLITGTKASDTVVKWVLIAGYPIELHNVETADGYKLKVHRIPHHRNINRGPILLAHAIVYSGLQWVIYPGRSLAYLLADEGFDVWIYHARGTSFSTGHKKFSTKSKEYWNFSWHEFGYYDLPAVINRMLKTCNSKKIHFVGHSQGSSALLVTLTTRPEYNEKIASAYFMAPAAFLQPTSGTNYFTKMYNIFSWLRRYALMWRENNFGICRNQLFALVCYNALVPLLGPFGPKIDKESSILVSTRHLVDNVALKQIGHFVQLVQSRRFQKYDYGKANIYYYGRHHPPLYDLSLVTIPVTLRAFSRDYIVTTMDARMLERKLNDVRSYGVIPGNHVEFLFDLMITRRVKNDILDSIDLLGQYTNEIERTYNNETIFEKFV